MPSVSYGPSWHLNPILIHVINHSVSILSPPGPTPGKIMIYPPEQAILDLKQSPA